MENIVYFYLKNLKNINMKEIHFVIITSIHDIYKKKNQNSTVVNFIQIQIHIVLCTI